nr:CBS domain-containing protein [Delftia acidovorans]
MEKVSDAMTRGVRTLAPQDTLQFAAQAMDELSVGSIPVCDGSRLVGMVTDRDITIRGTAQGLAPGQARLEQVMSDQVQWCFEDQSVQEAAQIMCDARVRRLPVVDRDKKLVGILSLGDVSVKADPAQAADALQDISTPSEPDRSGLSAAAGRAAGGQTR